MKKFNLKYNNAWARFTFWHALNSYFAGFYDLLQANDTLTSEDRLALSKIRKLLLDCYLLAKERKQQHSDKLTALIGQ